MDRPFWAIFLSIAIIGTITWLAIFEHNYHPRVYRLNEDLPERSASGGRVEEGLSMRRNSQDWHIGELLGAATLAVCENEEGVG